ncbi:hypothetical protein GCM10010472_06910 [Pseudonocardia halophobica]|uniref:HTH luxR-type domain-containing protein n=1 Tax=Pseudonocardia halophobica TaxID=29401 RepID=A0A9W6L6W9_9PSEU|nr:helix-turn-helix domain-containing protein [Pseudonocardia halophobica]GLL14792.1 hypothetical protein GCM10017577_59400 [Pseudonocardia halophobica]
MRTEADWLEFTAALFAEPLTEFPLERVAVMLRDTLDAGAVTTNDPLPGGGLRTGLYPSDADLDGARAEIEAWRASPEIRHHPLVRWYASTGSRAPVRLADVPARFARSFGEGRSLLRRGHVPHLLALPYGGGRKPRTLVPGRADPFSEAELALAGRVARLVDGLERQARAYAAALSGVGPDGIDAVRAIELTPRELAVLGLLSEGVTTRLIARRLGIGERTVHKHLERCYLKLGASDRITAVLRAQRFGLVGAR